jgi:hypothetical protein
METDNMRDQNRWDYEDERRRSQRGWTDRAGDEMRSWFGDEDAQARRDVDDREERWRSGPGGDRGWRDQGESYDGGQRYGGPRDRGYGFDPERRGYAGQSNQPSSNRPRGYRGEPQYAGQGGAYRHGGPAGRQYRQPFDDSYRGGPSYGSEGRDWRDWNESSWGAPTRQERQDFASFEAGARDWRDSSANTREPGDYETGSSWDRPGGTRVPTRESFSGRGPKDYKRSDDRIREEVSDRLTDDHAVDASNMTVQVQDGEVTLTGTVPNREQKRRAEDLAEAISGVREVTNNLRVNRVGEWQSQETGSESSPRGQATTQGAMSHATSGSGATSKTGRSSTTT